MSSRKTIWDEFKDHEFAHAYFDEFLNTYIATQLKVLREQRNLKQEELAEVAGMAQGRISIMENVNYSSWTVNTLRRLAKALGVRLKVSFETFSSGLVEMRSFNAKNLMRSSLKEELENYFAATKTQLSISDEKEKAAILAPYGNEAVRGSLTLAAAYGTSGKLTGFQVPQRFASAEEAFRG